MGRCNRLLLIVAKQGQFVPGAAVAQMGNFHTDTDLVGETAGRKVGATRIDNQPDHRAAGTVEGPLFDQERSDRRLAIRVIDHIVHMPVGVLIPPARRHVGEASELIPTRPLNPGTHRISM
ncbi:hypothetical protein D3C85_1538230 [compost metagenome]